MKKLYRIIILGIFVLTYLGIIANMVISDPVGGVIQSNWTSERTTSPSSRSDEGGTINTLLVDATQQNYAWKAYVGNVSGTLVLGDSNNDSIYSWSLTTLTGEIIATRASSPTWSSLSCADNTTVASEQSAVNMGVADIDSLNHTFNSWAHRTFTIAGNTLTADTCRSAATYVNQSSQTASSTAIFQQILINDSSSNLMYVGELEVDNQGYNNETFDFQLIIPDNDAANNQTTYYFYVELDS